MGRVIRADRRGPARVPAVLLDARAQAGALLTAARQDAERIRAQARQDAERIRARACEEGRAAGRAELASQLLRVTRDHEQAHERALAALEPQAIAVALQAAKQLVGAEIDAHPERIRAVVAPLLARLRRAHKLALHVHPEDRAALVAWLQSEQGKGAVAAELVVEPDPAVTRGGCVLRSDIGTLDAQVETQLDALARALGVT